MNKVLKGLVAVVSAVAMAIAGFAGAASATAAPETTTITINNASKGDQYAIYRLFDETETDAAEGGTAHVAYQKRTDWNHYSVIAAAIKTVNSSSTVTENSKVDDFVAAIGAFDAAETKTFAETVYASLKNANVNADGTSGPLTSESYTFSNVAQGYYLIVQTAASGDANKTMSAVIADTAGKKGVTVSTKKDTVTVEKKVQENQDGINDLAANWGTAADYNIGDKVPFKETGSLPADYGDYGTYEYVFHDIQSSGLTFNPDSVKVYADNGGVETEIASSSYSVLTKSTTPAVSGDNTFDVKFANLKEATAASAGDTLSITASTKIVVKYDSTLNDNAVFGKNGNPNEVYLEFSNNKYGEGTGNTKHHTVTVFTFKLTVSKYGDSVTDANKLKGAGFTLFKSTSQDGSYTKVGNEVVNTSGNTFDFTGLDSGYYKLVETTTPAGYNTIDPILFTVTATYSTDNEPGTLTDLTATGPADQTFATSIDTGEAGKAQITTNVVDRSGSTLPSTGGMGTKILYAAGAVIVLVAAFGIVFAVRRRNAR